MKDPQAEFVALARQPGANRRALCRRFGISHTTGYKWLRESRAQDTAPEQSVPQPPNAPSVTSSGSASAISHRRPSAPPTTARPASA